jgi:hypothetical protein
MGRYRKKPVIVEAFHWTGDQTQTEDPEWIVEAIREGEVTFIPSGPGKTVCMLIRTLEGDMIASPGDFIIQGVTGELYPCKPNIFNLIYEEVK